MTCDESERRFQELGQLGRRLLDDGTTVDQLIRRFYEAEQLGAIGSIRALLEVEPIGLAAGKQLLSMVCERKLRTIGRDELRYIAHAHRLPSAGDWRSGTLVDAIIDGRPWLLYARDKPGSVHIYRTEVRGEVRWGSISGSGVSFERIRDEARAAAAMPEWRDDLAIVRDEPDEILLRFPRVLEATR